MSDGPTLRTLAPTEAPTHDRVELCGTYSHAVDAKGRVAVPALLRRSLPDGSVVARGPERRLLVWPPDEWHRERDRFRRMAESPAQERRFLRQLTIDSAPFEVDAQGRLVLSAAQRRWAAIADSAVFVGLGTCVEIVGEEVWSAENLDLDPDEFTRLHDLVHRAGEPADSASQ